jgi:hypothetical protein
MAQKKIEGLPTIEDIQQEITEEKQTQAKSRGQKKNKLKPVLIILAVIAAGLFAISLFGNQLFPAPSGNGIVSGTVVNASGSPISAQIYVVNTSIYTTADSRGQFTLHGVPVGHQTVLIAYQGQGVELPVDIQNGGEASVGSVTVVSTQVPSK